MLIAVADLAILVAAAGVATMLLILAGRIALAGGVVAARAFLPRFVAARAFLPRSVDAREAVGRRRA
jgi:hypothetical protein